VRCKKHTQQTTNTHTQTTEKKRREKKREENKVSFSIANLQYPLVHPPMGHLRHLLVPFLHLHPPAIWPQCPWVQEVEVELRVEAEAEERQVEVAEVQLLLLPLLVPVLILLEIQHQVLWLVVLLPLIQMDFPRSLYVKFDLIDAT
jgi:hypothetical protein